MSSNNQQVVPHAPLYEAVERLTHYAEIILYISTALSLIISCVDYLKVLDGLKTPLIVINSIMVCLFVFFENRANYIFTKAEMKRRLDYLDNSFNTNFSGKKSENYFTNDNLSPGLYKLCVNSFENSVHTEFIFGKMFTKILWQTIVILILFIISAYVGNRELVRLFFELILPLALIQRLIKAIYYLARMGNVVTNFKALFNDLSHADISNKTPEFIRDILDYETTIAWAAIPLNSNLFKKYRNHLAEEWDGLKNSYQIKS